MKKKHNKINALLFIGSSAFMMMPYTYGQTDIEQIRKNHKNILALSNNLLEHGGKLIENNEYVVQADNNHVIKLGKLPDLNKNMVDVGLRKVSLLDLIKSQEHSTYRNIELKDTRHHLSEFSEKSQKNKLANNVPLDKIYDVFKRDAERYVFEGDKKNKKIKNKFGVGMAYQKPKDLKHQYNLLLENQLELDKTHHIDYEGYVGYANEDFISGKSKYHNYGSNIAYKPHLNVNGETEIYPILGVGLEETNRKDERKNKVKRQRQYVQTGLGIQHGNLNTEINYQKDFKQKDEMKLDNQKQKFDVDKGEKYGIEVSYEYKILNNNDSVKFATFYNEKHNRIQNKKQKEKELGLKVLYQFE